MLLNAALDFLIAQYYIVILQVNYFYTSHKPKPLSALRSCGFLFSQCSYRAVKTSHYYLFHSVTGS
jgi:hypothetical protein